MRVRRFSCPRRRPTPLLATNKVAPLRVPHAAPRRPPAFHASPTADDASPTAEDQTRAASQLWAAPPGGPKTPRPQPRSSADRRREAPFALPKLPLCGGGDGRATGPHWPVFRVPALPRLELVIGFAARVTQALEAPFHIAGLALSGRSPHPEARHGPPRFRFMIKLAEGCALRPFRV